MNVSSNAISDVPSYDFHEFAPRKNKYCVCVFVIDEGDRLLKQLEQMRSYETTIDIVIADGGTTDGSTEKGRLAELGVNSLLVKTGAGRLGAQMRMAFEWALGRGYEGVVVIDGNGKDGVDAIPHFIAELEKGADFVQGSRFIKGGVSRNLPYSRLLGVRFLHAPTISWAAGLKYTDTTNGFRAYSARLLRDTQVDLFRDVFAGYELHYYLAIKAAKLGMQVKEIPVSRCYPRRGVVPTKISPVRGNLKVLRCLAAACLGRYDASPSNTINRKVIGFLAIAVLSLAVLFMGFSSNYWKTVDDYEFDVFQQGSESLVLGRLNFAQHNGLWKQPFGLGRYRLASGEPYGRYDVQHRLYVSGEPGVDYVRYPSQIGLQGIFYSLIDAVIPGSNLNTLHFINTLNAFCLSVVLTLFILWCCLEFGVFAAVITLVCLVGSDWLTLFGRTMYWAVWLWYLPFIVSLLLLAGEERVRRYSHAVACVGVFIAILLKSMCGYEYISTIMVSLLIPYVYYAIRDSWGKWKFLKRTALVGIAALVGFLSTLAGHAVSEASILGSNSRGIEIITKVALKRTYPTEALMDKVSKESVEVPLSNILRVYFNDEPVLWALTAKTVLFVVLALLPLVFVDPAIIPRIGRVRPKLLALVGAMLCALLATLSWYVLGKQHSFVHTHMNFVLWNLPFTMYASVFVATLTAIVCRTAISITPPLIRYVVLPLLTIVIAVTYVEGRVSADRYLAQKLDDSVFVVVKEGYDVYFNAPDQSIYYLKRNPRPEDYERRFFLHVHPQDQNSLPASRKGLRYWNMDFKAGAYEIANLSFWGPYRDALVLKRGLPTALFKSIETGQYSPSTGKYWATTLSQEAMYAKFQPSIEQEVSEITTANFSDSRWDRGVGRFSGTAANVLLFNNTAINWEAIEAANTVLLPDGEERLIRSVKKPTPNWIHVKLTGDPVSSEVGFPKKLRFVSERMVWRSN